MFAQGLQYIIAKQGLQYVIAEKLSVRVSGLQCRKLFAIVIEMTSSILKPVHHYPI